jgi:predicted nucleic acid-binding protein
VLVVGEIRQGIERLARRDRAQAEIYEHWLSQLVDGYDDRIVPITVRIAEEWGRLNVPDPNQGAPAGSLHRRQLAEEYRTLRISTLRQYLPG